MTKINLCLERLSTNRDRDVLAILSPYLSPYLSPSSQPPSSAPSKSCPTLANTAASKPFAEDLENTESPVARPPGRLDYIATTEGSPLRRYGTSERGLDDFVAEEECKIRGGEADETEDADEDVFLDIPPSHSDWTMIDE